MAQAYLFVHFRKKQHRDGEQVYFISAMVSLGKLPTTALRECRPGIGAVVADSLCFRKNLFTF